uniref:Protein FAM162A n=1 Tax=Xenopus tropicalis TaxID=8364 RepID=A0A803JJG5_XENTR
MSAFSLIRYKSLARGLLSAGSSTRTALQGRSYCQAVKDIATKETKPQTNSGKHLFKHERRPTDFDKKILVWSGRYKKAEDIPEFISYETLSASRNKVRIKICYAMIAGTILGCIAMVISGKKVSDLVLLSFYSLNRKSPICESATSNLGIMQVFHILKEKER